MTEARIKHKGADGFITKGVMHKRPSQLPQIPCDVIIRDLICALTLYKHINYSNKSMRVNKYGL